MFVGHYGASLALKRVDKNASLGMLFLAVQFVDILFFPFVLLGIEHFNIVENYTASTHFELEFMPYTHSLFGVYPDFSNEFASKITTFIRKLLVFPLGGMEDKNRQNTFLTDGANGTV